MAIVFISPKAKQKIFFRIVTIILVLSLVVVSLVVMIAGFVNKNQTVPNVSVNQPNISVNLDVIDSDKFLRLEPFINLETEFAYVVQNQDNKEIRGNMLAASKQEAQKLLEDSGVTVISLKEANIGNSQPFVSY